jgi:hypothetical protein
MTQIEGTNGYVYDIEKDTWSKPIKVVINDVEFEEVSWDLFIVFGEEDKFPFLKSDFSNEGIHYPLRVYKSIAINGKFYAPIIK